MSERVNITQELHRCKSYLKDREVELPSHLKQTDLSVLSTQKQIELLEEKLAKIDKAAADVVAKELKLKESSLKKVLAMKTKLYKLREEMDKDISSLHGSHRAVFFELSKTLAQVLRNYKPKGK